MSSLWSTAGTWAGGAFAAAALMVAALLCVFNWAALAECSRRARRGENGPSGVYFLPSVLALLATTVSGWTGLSAWTDPAARAIAAADLGTFTFLWVAAAAGWAWRRATGRGPS